jgi:hypothetical protein
VDGVEIDLIAGFVIEKGDVEYYHPLKRGSALETIELHGAIIPLQSVAEWRTYYEQMGRSDKVAMIDDAAKR